MSAALIAQLLIQFGPSAVALIQQLAAVWNKPELSLDEVNSLCVVAQTSYDKYRSDAKAAK